MIGKFQMPTSYETLLRLLIFTAATYGMYSSTYIMESGFNKPETLARSLAPWMFGAAFIIGFVSIRPKGHLVRAMLASSTLLAAAFFGIINVESQMIICYFP